ncbi:MAG: cell wall hydrolase [Acidimicrobiales bacterium]|nr:cell wall hydrolase [Hyphomonadaceae bacterium]RZV43756.1 MAG: cell wall hydrolase [Acidimicrobiales bacterium]
MTNSRHIFLGWGLALTVTTAAFAGLPKLADASAMAKDQMRWENRAVAFQTTNETARSASEFAKTYASLHLDTSISNSWMRDLSVTTSLRGRSQSVMANAKAAKTEQQCLAEAIYYEARSERLPGQKAVAEVVLNRVNSKHFPNSICGVVYQGAHRTSGCQFSFTCDGSMDKMPKGKSWKNAQSVADHMIMGVSAPMTWRSTHYHTTDVNPAWSKTLRKTRKYDTHVFYRFQPRSYKHRPVSAAP